MMGGKRRLYDLLNSRVDWKIQKAYRMGINSIIQRTSAEMTKIAAINLQPLLKELDVKILLFIHDELILDVPENIGMDNMYRITEVMCNALPLVCGMKSDCELGYKWGQRMDKQEINAIREILDDTDDVIIGSSSEYEDNEEEEEDD
jgi:DNA polymerase-1